MKYEKLILGCAGVTIGYLLSFAVRRLGANPEMWLLLWIGFAIGAGVSYFVGIWTLSSDKISRAKTALIFTLGACTGLFLFITIIVYIILTTKPVYL